MARKKKRNGYAIFMCAYIIIVLVLIGVGLTWLWGYAEAYEASQPTSTMDEVVAELNKTFWNDDMAATIAAMPHEAQTDDECAEIIKSMIGSGVSYKRSGSTDTTITYNLVCDTAVLGAALAGELDEGGVGRVSQSALLCLLYRFNLGLREVDVCDEAETPRLKHCVYKHIFERGGRPLDQHVFYRQSRNAEKNPRGENEAEYPVNDALGFFPFGLLLKLLLLFFKKLLLFVVICIAVLHIHTFAVDGYS